MTAVIKTLIFLLIPLYIVFVICENKNDLFDKQQLETRDLAKALAKVYKNLNEEN